MRLISGATLRSNIGMLLYLCGARLCRNFTLICLGCILCLAAFNLHAQKWGTFTNTNNVTDVVMTNTGKIYAATWGGVVEYQMPFEAAKNKSFAQYVRTLTSVDGLASNDIRTLAFAAGTNDLWIGTASSGITILQTRGIQTLDTGSGLPSDKIRRIVVHRSYVYVATDLGISQFYYLPGVYFPLLLHQYNVSNTQGGLASNDVRDIAVSPQGYLYCATAAGVSYVHTDSLNIDSAWHKWTFANSPLPNSPILSISVNSDFVALNTMTSVHRRGSDPFVTDWQTWTRANGLQDSVFTVAIGSDGTINLGWGVWNEDTMTLRRKAEYSYGYIDSAGVVFGISGQPFELADLYELPESCIYRFFFPDPELHIFASWGEGIYIYEGWNTHNLVNNCIGFQTISEIVTDANHNVWLGSGWIGGTMTRKGTRGVSKLSNGIWTNYTISNSPLPSNNVKNLAVDQNNRKWFGSWWSDPELYHWYPGAFLYDDASEDWRWYTQAGVRQWDASSGWANPLPGSPTLLNNTIADVYVDKNGNILISNSGGGIVVFDKNYNRLGDFRMPGYASVYQSVSYIYHSGSRYFFGLRADDRLIIWNDASLPIGSDSHWLIPAPSELSACFIYGVVTVQNIFGEEENWIAASSGLFMWDGVNWYRYGADIKRRRFNNGQWVNDTLYFVDEERLFGSVRTAPTAIFLDPFGRIWIGSLENGFSMYDPETERFTNYFQANSPLLSNYITCFGYDPLGGRLLIGTPDGLNTLEIGIQIKTEEKLHTVKAFPNPFLPERDRFVRIVNLPSLSMPKGTNVCKIYDSAGQFVIELKENEFARFDWNGYNSFGKKCSTGIYYFVVTSSAGTTKRGKIALVR